MFNMNMNSRSIILNFPVNSLTLLDKNLRHLVGKKSAKNLLNWAFRYVSLTEVFVKIRKKMTRDHELIMFLDTFSYFVHIFLFYIFILKSRFFHYWLFVAPISCIAFINSAKLISIINTVKSILNEEDNTDHNS